MKLMRYGNEKIAPDLRHNDIIKFYTEVRLQGRCAAIIPSGHKPNGEVKFCPDKWIDDYVIGNIRQIVSAYGTTTEAKISENNSQAKAFRRLSTL
jgi:hypothetical protein